MWENTTRKTPNTNTFHAVLIAIFQGKVSTMRVQHFINTPAPEVVIHMLNLKYKKNFLVNNLSRIVILVVVFVKFEIIDYLIFGCLSFVRQFFLKSSSKTDNSSKNLSIVATFSPESSILPTS